MWAALCESSDIKERQRWSKRERACGMDIELVQNYLPVPLANRDMKKKLLMEIGEGGGGSYPLLRIPWIPTSLMLRRNKQKSEPVCSGLARGGESNSQAGNDAERDLSCAVRWLPKMA